MKTIAEQLEVLKQLIPELYYEDFSVIAISGNIAIPDWNLFGDTYAKALVNVLNIGGFVNDLGVWLNHDSIKSETLSQVEFSHAKNESNIEKVSFVDADFGGQNRNKSAEDVVREECPGLNAFSVAIQLIVHPELLSKYEDLWIICPGDKMAHLGNFFDANRFGRVPVFYFFEGKIHFGAIHGSTAFKQYGCATFKNP